MVKKNLNVNKNNIFKKSQLPFMAKKYRIAWNAEFKEKKTFSAVSKKIIGFFLYRQALY